MSFAHALARHREKMRQRAYWRGGRVDQDRQDQDIVAEEANYRPKNTSGEPETNDPEEMEEENYAEGGRVRGVTEVTEDNKNDVADEHHSRHMRGVRHSKGLEHEDGGYAYGGEVHEERREHFGAEPEEDDKGDVMLMAQKLKRRALRRYG